MAGWEAPLLGALLGMLVAFVGGYRAAAGRLSALERDVATLRQQAVSTEKAAALETLSLKRDVDALQHRQKDCVTAYELERRWETWAARKDELRRRIVAVETRVWGWNLDGLPAPSQVQIMRNDGEG